MNSQHSNTSSSSSSSSLPQTSCPKQPQSLTQLAKQKIKRCRSNSSSFTPSSSPPSVGSKALVNFSDLAPKRQKRIVTAVADKVEVARELREQAKEIAREQCETLWSRFFAMESTTPKWSKNTMDHLRKFWVVLKASAVALTEITFATRPSDTILHVQFDKTSLDFRQDHEIERITRGSGN